ncbi:c-type cytochrome [Pseudomonas typographi]|uniref:C-type cytochrome n=1 Tax=Pseudomonas typographi TaxID=2715964 RepID=A0ABR7Z3R4_9PSED|nr:c-type cytochrome [Pseudomonas typographi]MBD1551923.1 c-type cytochrome [Pseudomonas typographi]MBD1599988.1 c-type cytochrome [Pseudomonas typographi]
MSRYWLALLITCASLDAWAQVDGRSVFVRCQACHSLDGEGGGIGPDLHGVLNSRAAARQGFRYSNALLKSNIVWTRENLFEFLQDPQAKVPGNRMAFSGLDTDEETQAVIDYLKGEH